MEERTFLRHRGMAYQPLRDILFSVSKAWSEQREEIIRSGEKISAHIRQLAGTDQNAGLFSPELLANAARTLIDNYDRGNGGWGAAPKFPMPMTIDFLLRRHLAGDADALEPALHALKAMAHGGMYDVVGGGFSRYSTDNDWLVPHFEKMLYDNAQLVQAYLHAWQITEESLPPARWSRRPWIS